jgi:hypothetical protein
MMPFFLVLDPAATRGPDYIPEKTGERVIGWQEKKPDETATVCLMLIIMRWINDRCKDLLKLLNLSNVVSL